MIVGDLILFILWFCSITCLPIARYCYKKDHLIISAMFTVFFIVISVLLLGRFIVVVIKPYLNDFIEFINTEI